MGVIKHFSSSSGDCTPYNDDEPTKIIRVNSTPDPKHFDLINYRVIGQYLIVKVRYPECENYEGVKIMVYERNDIVDNYKDILIHNKGALDPHFGVNKKFISPIARFEPTENGWVMAIKFCKSMDI